MNEVPIEVKQKKAQMEKIQTELQNLLNFIKAGNFSKLVSEAIVDAEGRQENLKSEMKETWIFHQTRRFSSLKL